jgi:hypothetical protein
MLSLVVAVRQFERPVSEKVCSTPGGQGMQLLASFGAAGAPVLYDAVPHVGVPKPVGKHDWPELQSASEAQPSLEHWLKESKPPRPHTGPAATTVVKQAPWMQSAEEQHWSRSLGGLQLVGGACRATHSEGPWSV